MNDIVLSNRATTMLNRDGMILTYDAQLDYTGDYYLGTAVILTVDPIDAVFISFAALGTWISSSLVASARTFWVFEQNINKVLTAPLKFP